MTSSDCCLIQQFFFAFGEKFDMSCISFIPIIHKLPQMLKPTNSNEEQCAEHGESDRTEDSGKCS